MLSHAKEIGLDHAQLIERAEINPNWLNQPDSFVDTRYLIKLAQEMIIESHDESLGFAAEPIALGFRSVMMDYVITSETLGTLLHRGERLALHLKGVNSETLSHQIVDSDCKITFQLEYKSQSKRFCWDFLVLSSIYGFMCWSIDSTIVIKDIQLKALKEENFILEPVEDFFNTPITYGSEENSFIFSKSVLDKPIVKTRTDLRQWLRNSPDDFLYIPGKEKTISNQIKAHLKHYLEIEESLPSFEEICNSLHSSPQVVRRQLGEEGIAFQNLKDKVRCDRVKELLRAKSISTNDIAIKVGFTEVSALNRAFKNWTGITPAEYRKSR